MKATAEQENIYSHFKKETGNIGISAYAGCGKTTTILQMLKITKFSQKVRFFAFSNLIADELKKKVGESVDVSTIHSLGFSILRKNFKNVKIKENKVLGFVTKYSKKTPTIKGKISTFNFKANQIILKTDPTLKEYNLENLYEICEKFKIKYDDDLLLHTIKIKKTIEDYDSKQKDTIFVDFNDMVTLPIKLNLQFEKYDVCFFDEAQDMSQCHKEMLLRSLKSEGRFVTVFDKRQSIFGFAGADTKVLDSLIKEKVSKVFPLSYSFRCSKSVVSHCIEVYEGFKAFPTNNEGNVRDGSIKEVRSFKTDVVLCRNTKPLIDVYSYLVANNIPCFVKGKDYGKALIKLLKSQRTENVYSTTISLERYLSDIECNLISFGVSNPKSTAKYMDEYEKVSILKKVLQKNQTVSKTILALTEIFKNRKDAIPLMTIHKSKGLEFSRVFIMRNDLIPSKYATNEFDIEQERNLDWVKRSRAKDEIVYITDFWGDAKENQVQINKLNKNSIKWD